MSEKKTIYITTTLPYVNAEPHIGHALESVQADTFARYKRLIGTNVFFNTGSDEHGQKIYEASQNAQKDVVEYVNYYASKFAKLKEALNLSYDRFIRTTESEHIIAAQQIWLKCLENGDIYEKEFEGLYCVGCERFLMQKDLSENICPIHLKEPIPLKEKNWFFRLSKYQNQILNYLEKNNSIVPEWRREEAINFAKEGLEDFSVSRDRSRLSWGIDVPNDETQVMYVWFDALTNYISTLGWPDAVGNFKKYWIDGEVVQFAGKDQVRFQSIMWQGMLLSAGIKNSDKVFYHGFINSGGQKMSKSLGNVISPYDLVNKYGTEATRYFFLRHIHPTLDTDVTWDKLDEWYTSGLVNGIGNLVSRILTMAENYELSSIDYTDTVHNFSFENKDLEELNFQEYMNFVWDLIQKLDQKIQYEEPYKKIKTDRESALKIVNELCVNLLEIALRLKPAMPETSALIEEGLRKLKKPTNLFPRLN